MGQRTSTPMKFIRMKYRSKRFDTNNSAKVIIQNNGDEIEWDGDIVTVKDCYPFEKVMYRCEAAVQFDGISKIESAEKGTETKEEYSVSNESPFVSLLTKKQKCFQISQKSDSLNDLSSEDRDMKPSVDDTITKNPSSDSGCFCTSKIHDPSVPRHEISTGEINCKVNLTGFSEEDASLKEFELLEKMQENSGFNVPIQNQPFVSPRKKRIKMTPNDDESPMPRNSNRIIEAHFWIPYTTQSIRIFTDSNDRRIESIARMSDCKIFLTPRKRRSIIGDLQRSVRVVATSEKSLEKCWNLFNEKFPLFFVGTGCATKI